MLTLNQYIDLCRRNRYAGAKAKNTIEHSLCAEMFSQKCSAYEQCVTLHYLWYWKDKKTDKSNIAFAQKFVEDALVKARILKGDGWKFVDGFTHEFEVDSKDPRLELIIKPLMM